MLPILLLLCSCSMFAVGWCGRGTTQMTTEEAWIVLQDPAAPENRRLLAEHQLFRIGERAKGYLAQLASEPGTVGEQALRHLALLRQ